MKPRLLDLFCGAGGAAKGYQRAGFYVVGVDSKPQPNYCGDDFVQYDAMTVSIVTVAGGRFDAIHASPPCQRYSTLAARSPDHEYPDLYAAIRLRLMVTGLPWIIENVIGAPYRSGFVLCGSMFGLKVRRHRNFESSHVFMPPACDHARQGRVLGVYGNGGGGSMTRGFKANQRDWPEIMQMPWAKPQEIAQAIPPAYTEWIGGELLRVLAASAPRGTPADQV